MIIGLGTDIVNIERIEKALAQFGQRFLERSFSPSEQAEILARPDARAKAAKAAKLFAAKEAAAKALGTGFSDGMRMDEVQISHDQRGKPLLHFSGTAEAVCAKLAGACETRVHLSLSDDFPFATAVVIIEI